MDINEILDSFKIGIISKDDALKEINDSLYLKYEHLVVDTFREKRTGFPEFIYGKSKSLQQLISIADVYLKKQLNFICTGLTKTKIEGLKKQFTDFEYIEEAGFVRHIVKPLKKLKGSISIISGGLSDLKVSLECSETLNSLNVENFMISDVGVAGIHRLFIELENINKSSILIVIAGMEGALPSIIAGITYKPVIAVPTSVGYGAANNGFTPLFSMLSSCANGLTVVNIDNGFGAAIAAYRILFAFSKAK
jgi:NCAIR mutase (PurE)-related protein